MNGRADARAQNGEIFSKIETSAQLSDGFLPGEKFRRRRRLGEPSRQRFLAGPRSGGAQQFEQRAFAKEVEVLRVEMRVVAKYFRGRTPADPAIVNPRQSIFIKHHGLPGALFRSCDPFMNRDEDAEDAEWDQCPPQRKEAAPDAQANREHEEQSDTQAHTAKPEVVSLELLDGLAARFQPAAVFEAGISVGCQHRFLS